VIWPVSQIAGVGTSWSCTGRE